MNHPGTPGAPKIQAKPVAIAETRDHHGPKANGMLDRFGATASFLCAVHCAALPFVIAILPAMGLSFLASHWFERIFVAVALVIAFTSMIAGFRAHRRKRAFVLLIPGTVLLICGVTVDLHKALTLHAVLVSCGGTLVALSHLTNLRLSANHVCRDGCQHAA